MSKITNAFFFCLMASLLLISLAACDKLGRQQSDVTIYHLSCEYDASPLGVVAETPRFSWMLQSDELGQKQTAYRILVADDPALLERGTGNMWDSRKVRAEQSVLVPYQGKPFASSTTYWWKAMAWDQHGRPTHWSEPAMFETGLIMATDWGEAKWIGIKEDTRESEHRFRKVKTERMDKPATMSSYPSPLFRKEYKVKPGLQTARAYVSGLGYHELTINGNKVGDHLLDPAQTTYDVYAKYVVHDIGNYLLEGNNAFGVMLGSGFYGQNIAFPPANLNFGPPRLLAMFLFTYEDGTVEQLKTGNDWKVTCGPIVFDNVFAGESYDARYEIPGWNLPGFDDTSWQKAEIVEKPSADLRPQTIPPIREKEVLKPVDIFRDGDKWVVDFGQNISGWVRIRVNENPGTVIQIRMAESLYRHGKSINTYSTGHFATGVEQIDVYVCKGGQEEMWEPRFTYHGFQFAEISGLSEKPDAHSIEAVWVYSDLEQTGSFASSDPRLNQIHQISMNTIKGNIHGLPEDCPHREKCGWLGDAHAMGEAILFNFDAARFFDKYIEDIIGTLGRGGGHRNQPAPMVPTMVAPGKRLAGVATMDWGVALVLLPWYMYNYYGDIKPFENNYHHIKTFVDYMMGFINDNGTLDNGLGDWCPPRWDRINNPDAMECHPFISSTAFLYETCLILHKMATVLNDTEYAEWAKLQAEKLKQAFNEQFLDAIEGTPFYWYGSQTATVMAFRFGMVPEERHKEVVGGLIYDIEVVNAGHHTCGIFGLRHIYTVLNELGLSYLAIDILTTPDFPSQTYIMNAGLTTWPERQWEWSSGIEWDRSLNHPMQSGFAAWFHESLGGIQPDPKKPGFKNILLKPHPAETIEWAKAEMRSMYGSVVSAWSQQENMFQWEINIPTNSQATVFVPSGKIVIESACRTQQVTDNHVSLIRNEGDFAVYTFASGAYMIRSQRNR